MLKEAGYKTFIGGKWQLYGAEHYNERFRGKGSLPGKTGFDHWCLWQVDKLGDRYWNPLLNIDGENRQFEKDDYGPDIVTDHLLQFMETNRNETFFVYYPMILVHNPFLPSPESSSRKNKNKQKNFEDMVRHMDHLVGRIVQKTEKLGIAEKTLIFFTGDNGTNKAITSELNGRTIQGGKGKTTDAGTRVALVACQPGTVPAGKVCSDLVDFSDFVPTLRNFAENRARRANHCSAITIPVRNGPNRPASHATSAGSFTVTVGSTMCRRTRWNSILSAKRTPPGTSCRRRWNRCHLKVRRC
jgi:arylsulfatase A